MPAELYSKNRREVMVGGVGDRPADHRNGDRTARYQYTLLADDLYACQSICELFLEAGFDFILVCKPESHVALYEQVDFLAKNGMVEQLTERHWKRCYAEFHHYRWVNEVPLRRAEDALQVNGCAKTASSPLTS